MTDQTQPTEPALNIRQLLCQNCGCAKQDLIGLLEAEKLLLIKCQECGRLGMTDVSSFDVEVKLEDAEIKPASYTG